MKHLFWLCGLLILAGNPLLSFGRSGDSLSVRTHPGLEIGIPDSTDLSFIYQPYQWGFRLQTGFSHRHQFDEDATRHFFLGSYTSLLTTLKVEYHELFAGPSLLLIPDWEPNAESGHARNAYAGIHLGYRYYLGYFVFPTEVFFQMDIRYTRVKYKGVSPVSGEYFYSRDIFEGGFGVGLERELLPNLRGNAGASLGFRTRGEGMTLSGFLGVGYTFPGGQ